MSHIGGKLIGQSSPSSSSSSSDKTAGRLPSESFKKDLTKIPKTSGQSSNEAVKDTDHHSLINDPKSSSNLTSSKEQCNNVIDYLKGKITGNGSKEDEDKLKANEDDSNNDNPSCNWNHSETGLSNSREALISTQSSLLDASN